MRRRGGYRGIFREEKKRKNHASGVIKSQNVKKTGTDICSMGYQNSDFKISLSLFGCMEKHTEQTTHCALLKH